MPDGYRLTAEADSPRPAPPPDERAAAVGELARLAVEAARLRCRATQPEVAADVERLARIVSDGLLAVRTALLAPAPSAPSRSCTHCGGPLPRGCAPSRTTCSDRCRSALARATRAARMADAGERA